jgi:hypothetical protein
MRTNCSCFDTPGDVGDIAGGRNGVLKGVWNKRYENLDDLKCDV